MYNILIILSQRKLFLYKDNKLIREYRVAVGKPDSPTITGKFKILQKLKNPGGLFGKRWMRMYRKYGIHGTNEIEVMGKAVTHGSIRMTNKDIVDLYDFVKVGTPVEVRY